MKNLSQERLRIRAKQFHLNHPWSLQKGGIFSRRVHEPELALSWWGEYGFIQNGRRVTIWCAHPRFKYADAIRVRACEMAGDEPDDSGSIFNGNVIWKKVGRSRKKKSGRESKPISEDYEIYLERLTAIATRLGEEAIDLEIAPSMRIQQYGWCTGIDLCVPIEVRSANEALTLVALARQLLKRETTLTSAFPLYRYGRRQWISEAAARKEDLNISRSTN